MKRQLLTAALAAVFSLSTQAEPKQTKNPVLGQAAGKKIYLMDVATRIRSIPELRNMNPEKAYQGVTQQMMAEHFLKQEAVATIKDSDSDLKAKLEEYKNQAKLEIFLKRKIDKLVTNEELLKLYNEAMKKFKPKPEVEAQHILVRLVGRSDEQAKAKAQGLINKLKAGADFDTVAKESSEDTVTKENGGSLGKFIEPIAAEAFGKEFAGAVFVLKAGAFTQKPVKTKLGYHIVKVKSRGMSKAPTFDQALPQFRRIKSQQALIQYIDKLLVKKGAKFFDLNGKEIVPKKVTTTTALKK